MLHGGNHRGHLGGGGGWGRSPLPQAPLYPWSPKSMSVNPPLGRGAPGNADSSQLQQASVILRPIDLSYECSLERSQSFTRSSSPTLYVGRVSGPWPLPGPLRRFFRGIFSGFAHPQTRPLRVLPAKLRLAGSPKEHWQRPPCFSKPKNVPGKRRWGLCAVTSFADWPRPRRDDARGPGRRQPILRLGGLHPSESSGHVHP